MYLETGSDDAVVDSLPSYQCLSHFFSQYKANSIEMLVLVGELENGHSIIVELIASYTLHLTDSEDGQSLVFKFCTAIVPVCHTGTPSSQSRF